MVYGIISYIYILYLSSFHQEAEDAGEDYEKVKMLGETAEDIEITERRKRKKKNMDPGFSG